MSSAVSTAGSLRPFVMRCGFLPRTGGHQSVGHFGDDDVGEGEQLKAARGHDSGEQHSETMRREFPGDGGDEDGRGNDHGMLHNQDRRRAGRAEQGEDRGEHEGIARRADQIEFVREVESLDTSMMRQRINSQLDKVFGDLLMFNR